MSASSPAQGSGPIVVIGAGISGLSAAHRLLALRPDADVIVLEASERAGGWIGSVERDGFVIERGADAILPQEPAFYRLVDALGLRERLVRTRPDRHGAYVLRSGELARIPDGWSLLGPASLASLRDASVLSPASRLRVLGDLVVGRAAAPESLAAFARRRLGWEALERLGQPLASGIYGSDAESLGLSPTLPRFAKLEEEHGSVLRGLSVEREQREAKEGTSGARYGMFVAFDRGMQVLIDALTQSLGERLRLGEGAVSLRRCDHGFDVVTPRRTIAAGSVVVALPGPAASALVASLDGPLADALHAVPHASATTVTFAFDRAAVAHPLDAYGVIVPAVERRRILAMTWASEKWPHRAPEGQVLIRVFVAGPGEGSATTEDVASELTERGDDAVTRTALRELRALLGVTGEPRFAIVSRFPRAMPRYLVHHEETRAAVAQRLEALPGLQLAGNALSGVGIPHAIASGHRAAEAIAGSRARRSAA